MSTRRGARLLSEMGPTLGEQIADKDGRLAFQQHITFDHCPYGAPTLVRAWQCGWEAAQKETEELSGCTDDRS